MLPHEHFAAVARSGSKQVARLDPPRVFPSSPCLLFAAGCGAELVGRNCGLESGGRIEGVVLPIWSKFSVWVSVLGAGGVFIMMRFRADFWGVQSV